MLDVRAEPHSFPTSPILPSSCTNFIVTSALILGESLQPFCFYSQDPKLVFTPLVPRAKSTTLCCTASTDPKKLQNRTIHTLGKVKSKTPTAKPEAAFTPGNSSQTRLSASRHPKDCLYPKSLSHVCALGNREAQGSNSY